MTKVEKAEAALKEVEGLLRLLPPSTITLIRTAGSTQESLELVLELAKTTLENLKNS